MSPSAINLRKKLAVKAKLVPILQHRSLDFL